jgi:hypothetical protein
MLTACCRAFRARLSFIRSVKIFLSIQFASFASLCILYKHGISMYFWTERSAQSFRNRVQVSLIVIFAKYKTYARFCVLTGKLKFQVPWERTPCRFVCTYIYFGGFRCIHLQDNSGNSLVCPKDGGKTLFRNDSSNIEIYTASCRRRLEILCTIC